MEYEYGEREEERELRERERERGDEEIWCGLWWDIDENTLSSETHFRES